MKTFLSIALLASAFATSAFADQYAAPAAISCKGAQYDLTVTVKGLSPGEIAGEYEDTSVVLADKNAGGEVRSFANNGAGYDVRRKTYYYHDEDNQLVMTVKPRLFSSRAKVILHLGDKKILTYRQCRLFMEMPADMAD